MALDSRHSTRTHTTTNQKQVVIKEDSKERWCDYGEVKVRRFGDDIVGRGILIKK
jgi:hypothetical protein